MKRLILILVLFAMLMGTGLAQNATTGDVKAFQKALQENGFTYSKVNWALGIGLNYTT